MIAKKSFQSIEIIKDNSKTFQAENREILKNSQLQINFAGSYKKRVYLMTGWNTEIFQEYQLMSTLISGWILGTWHLDPTL